MNVIMAGERAQCVCQSEFWTLLSCLSFKWVDRSVDFLFLHLYYVNTVVSPSLVIIVLRII